MVSSEEIVDLTRTLAETVLSMSVEPMPAREPLAPEERATFAWVRISGAWDGSVMLGCSETLARRVAGVMFGLPPEDATAGDVTDAVGELANVLGGNVKGLLSGAPSRLSIPVVSAERAPPDLAGDTRELWFECHGEPLVVLVTLRQPSAA